MNTDLIQNSIMNNITEYKPISVIFDNTIMPLYNLYNIKFETVLASIEKSIEITYFIINEISLLVSYILYDTIVHVLAGIIYVSSISYRAFKTTFEDNYDYAFLLFAFIGIVLLNIYDKYLQATIYQPTLANKINSLENEIISIKKRERMHNEDMENIMRILGQMQKKNATKADSDQDIVTFQNEISIKFNELNNKFKKFTREVKQYI